MTADEFASVIHLFILVVLSFWHFNFGWRSLDHAMYPGMPFGWNRGSAVVRYGKEDTPKSAIWILYPSRTLEIGVIRLEVFVAVMVRTNVLRILLCPKSFTVTEHFLNGTTNTELRKVFKEVGQLFEGADLWVCWHRGVEEVCAVVRWRKGLDLAQR